MIAPIILGSEAVGHTHSADIVYLIIIFGIILTFERFRLFLVSSVALSRIPSLEGSHLGRCGSPA
jgi:hypothetical protein